MCLPVDDNEESSGDNNNIMGDGCEPPTDEEEDAAKGQPPDTYWCCSKALNVEFDAYRDKGGPRPTKHLRAVHEKYRQLIYQHVGRCVTASTSVNPPRVLEPMACAGDRCRGRRAGSGVPPDGRPAA